MLENMDESLLIPLPDDEDDVFVPTEKGEETAQEAKLEAENAMEIDENNAQRLLPPEALLFVAKYV